MSQGKNLWVRAPDGTWVTLPQGDLENPSLRSWNVRDQTGSWQVPALHPYGGVFHGRVPDAQEIFWGSVNDRRDGWLWLTNLRERPDPNWRIEYALNSYEQGGHVGKGYSYYWDNPPADFIFSDTWYDGFFCQVFKYVEPDIGGWARTREHASIHMGLVDIAAITRYFVENWRTFRYDGGWYYPIDLMSVTRVEFNVDITMIVRHPFRYVGDLRTAPVPGIFAAPVFSVGVFRGLNTVTVPGGQYGRRAPVFAVEGAGDIIYSQTGVTGEPVAGYMDHWEVTNTTRVFIAQTDNADYLGFSCRCDNLPLLSGPDPYRAEYRIFVSPSVTVHYARPGYQSPPETWWTGEL